MDPGEILAVQDTKSTLDDKVALFWWSTPTFYHCRVTSRWNTAATQSDDPATGLHVGSSVHRGAYGTLGYLVGHSSTIREDRDRARDAGAFTGWTGLSPRDHRRGSAT